MQYSWGLKKASYYGDQKCRHEAETHFQSFLVSSTKSKSVALQPVGPPFQFRPIAKDATHHKLNTYSLLKTCLALNYDVHGVQTPQTSLPIALA